MKDENPYRPYSPDHSLERCSCGMHGSQDEHTARSGAASRPQGQGDETQSRHFIEMAAVRALFPHDALRRRFLRAVGVNAARAAIASVLPLADLQAMAEEKRPLEKKDLKIGFIPINCATPLITAEPMGFYREQGLNVTLSKTAGWALVRDQMLNHQLDASHFLAPMPLAISMGLASAAQPMRVAAIQNVNGQAITLALKHKDNRDPKNWRGFKFAIPFEYSMHNFLLRYYLAEHGLDPDRDVQLRVTPPAEMIANLRAGNIDGFLGPDPFNQRAVYDQVGFIHILSRDIWDGHPCCAFGVTQDFIDKNPNTFVALYRSLLKASANAHKLENRPAIARAISTPNYLNQPETVILQALNGHYADGLGHVRDQADRTDFQPLPWYSMATWMLTQMQRWGYIKNPISYDDLAKKVFLLTDARVQMKALGQEVDQDAIATGMRKFSVMGREYDPADPATYLARFAIKRT
ncbi:CmpA/NrtA family ABC transporter substrate-binding protein [Paraburkholderia bannensis]|uniref:CmpA/NrtA family ABC transporter substrate-binding protein n=1 Tax=Paraburkholderia bannensis TaxID=765414 RepID=UPI002AB6D776|nr:CmpA/NrtA family ABC transporter substrate-binding protein [Paraburkholderia bannensis]